MYTITGKSVKSLLKIHIPAICKQYQEMGSDTSQRLHQDIAKDIFKCFSDEVSVVINSNVEAFNYASKITNEILHNIIVNALSNGSIDKLWDNQLQLLMDKNKKDGSRYAQDVLSHLHLAVLARRNGETHTGIAAFLQTNLFQQFQQHIAQSIPIGPSIAFEKDIIRCQTSDAVNWLEFLEKNNVNAGIQRWFGGEIIYRRDGLPGWIINENDDEPEINSDRSNLRQSRRLRGLVPDSEPNNNNNNNNLDVGIRYHCFGGDGGPYTKESLSTIYIANHSAALCIALARYIEKEKGDHLPFAIIVGLKDAAAPALTTMTVDFRNTQIISDMCQKIEVQLHLMRSGIPPSVIFNNNDDDEDDDQQQDCKEPQIKRSCKRDDSLHEWWKTMQKVLDAPTAIETPFARIPHKKRGTVSCVLHIGQSYANGVTFSTHQGWSGSVVQFLHKQCFAKEAMLISVDALPYNVPLQPHCGWWESHEPGHEAHDCWYTIPNPPPENQCMHCTTRWIRLVEHLKKRIRHIVELFQPTAVVCWGKTAQAIGPQGSICVPHPGTLNHATTLAKARSIIGSYKAQLGEFDYKQLQSRFEAKVVQNVARQYKRVDALLNDLGWKENHSHLDLLKYQWKLRTMSCLQQQQQQQQLQCTNPRPPSEPPEPPDVYRVHNCRSRRSLYSLAYNQTHGSQVEKRQAEQKMKKTLWSEHQKAIEQGKHLLVSTTLEWTFKHVVPPPSLPPQQQQQQRPKWCFLKQNRPRAHPVFNMGPRHDSFATRMMQVTKQGSGAMMVVATRNALHSLKQRYAGYGEYKVARTLLAICVVMGQQNNNKSTKTAFKNNQNILFSDMAPASIMLNKQLSNALHSCLGTGTTDGLQFNQLRPIKKAKGGKNKLEQDQEEYYVGIDCGTQTWVGTAMPTKYVQQVETKARQLIPTMAVDNNNNNNNNAMKEEVALDPIGGKRRGLTFVTAAWNDSMLQRSKLQNQRNKIMEPFNRELTEFAEMPIAQVKRIARADELFKKLFSPMQALRRVRRFQNILERRRDAAVLRGIEQLIHQLEQQEDKEAFLASNIKTPPLGKQSQTSRKRQQLQTKKNPDNKKKQKNKNRLSKIAARKKENKRKEKMRNGKKKLKPKVYLSFDKCGGGGKVGRGAFPRMKLMERIQQLTRSTRKTNFNFDTKVLNGCRTSRQAAPLESFLSMTQNQNVKLKVNKCAPSKKKKHLTTWKGPDPDTFKIRYDPTLKKLVQRDAQVGDALNIIRICELVGMELEIEKHRPFIFKRQVKRQVNKQQQDINVNEPRRKREMEPCNEDNMMCEKE